MHIAVVAVSHVEIDEDVDTRFHSDTFSKILKLSEEDDKRL